MRRNAAGSDRSSDYTSRWMKNQSPARSSLSSLLMPCASLLRCFFLPIAAIILAGTLSAYTSAQAGAPQTIAPQKLRVLESASPYQIEGVALNGITGEPIPRCRLIVRPAVWIPRSHEQSGATGPENTAEADEQGHFTLSLPKAGHWQLTGSARGFRSQSYQEHDGYFSAVVLSTASPTIDLTFRLIPDASIEGTVLDEAGEPVRNAQISLLQIPATSPDHRYQAPQHRGGSMTDDRGHYEFLAVAPGDYTLSLNAQPWYAVGYREIPRRTDKDAESPLDVVYPLTWFPGVADFASATPIAMRAGDRRLADFHLLPVAGHRLRISPAAEETGLHNLRAAHGGFLEGASPNFLSDGNTIPWLKEIAADGSEQPVGIAVNKTAQGDWELSGLAPGTYQVSRQGTDPRETSLLEIRPGSSNALDLSTTTPPASVAITLEYFGSAPGTPSGTGLPEAGLGSIQVSLISLATGRPAFAQRQTRPMRSVPIAHDGAPNTIDTDVVSAASSDETLHAQLVPGRYEVVVNGAGGDLYLTKISGSGAETTGRLVELHAGEAKLVLHLAKGHASVRGVVKQNKLPDTGAMLLLVPATLGDDRSLTVLRRDQTNSDGSFEIEDVIPGAYILVAIDHGWMVNWNDPSTLRRYLLGGVALDLTMSAEVHRELEAQTP